MNPVFSIYTKYFIVPISALRITAQLANHLSLTHYFTAILIEIRLSLFGRWLYLPHHGKAEALRSWG